jgi:hypothetical protein
MYTSPRPLLVIATGLLIAIGCGSSTHSAFDPDDGHEGTPDGGTSSSGGFGGGGNASLTIDPKNVTVVIDTATDPATPGSVTYKVLSGGTDVSADATFALETAELGTFAGATFTSADTLPGDVLGVSTTVQVTTPSGVGEGRLTVVKLRKNGTQRDFFFVVPYQQAPTPDKDTLEFSTALKQVDVAFAMDTTGSMTDSITNLRNALSGTLLSELQSAIPDVGLAIVDYRDYPYSTYGTPGDWPVKIHQKITTSLALAQLAVTNYVAAGGGDGPEGQIPAMYHVLTGEALTWPTGSVPVVTPAPGYWGAVDFRPGGVPVVVNITDAPWHGEGSMSYNFGAPTLAMLKAAFQDANAFFVDVTSGPEAQAEALSDATGSNVPPAAFGGACGVGKCCTGPGGAARSPTGPGGSCRLNFQHAGGSGVSTGIVTAIKAISVGATYDVTAVPSNDPSNPDGVDATKFIRALRAMGEGAPAAGCPGGPTKDSDGDGVDDTFLSVTVGTKVCFEVLPAVNTIVPAKDVPQFYNVLIDVIGVQGSVQLDSRKVLFLVPPADPSVH